ncbi:hypothetical protein [Streptomyces sp. NPDC018045]|uniref:hypothetical protein n=1 Tax=Streptomyces sp. NPDC018045 TaxID=3365037 RepID=UPI0037A5E629
MTNLSLTTSGLVLRDGVNPADAGPAGVLAPVAFAPQDHTRWPHARTSPSASPAPKATQPLTPPSSSRRRQCHRRPPTRSTHRGPFLVGHELSGGEWPRMAVACTSHPCLPHPGDGSPTAVGDARAEDRIYTRVKALAVGRATVAHGGEAGQDVHVIQRQRICPGQGLLT